MPRPPRIHVPGGLYHAILRGNHRQVIFAGEGDYLEFERILRGALNCYGARLHAYCWMPNHVHLAIEVGEPPLGRTMHLLASRYARFKQRQVPTTGHLFERRYRARLVAADQYLFALVRYIHRNPLRAGLVTEIVDYRWSSHRAYLGVAPADWLAVTPTLELFGTDRDAAIAGYRRFMADEPADDEILEIRVACGGPRSAAAAPVTSGRPGRACRERGLEDIVREVAAEAGLAAEQLASRGRLPVLVRARAEIARRALHEGVATLAQVASRLGRAPSSLSELLAKNRSGT